MSYPVVKIHNSTDFSVEGDVVYCSAFCSDDSYGMAARGYWEAKGRGVCLVKKISAKLNTPNGVINATPYTSSGTSYSEFAIVHLGVNDFAVTRIVNGEEDVAPSNYEEPTETQK